MKIRTKFNVSLRNSSNSSIFKCNVLWEVPLIVCYTHYIRASVDALYRDGTSEISHDPRTKLLKTRWEWLPRPSKHTNGPISCSQRPHTHLPFSTRDFAHTRLHDFLVIINIFFFFFFNPAISLPEPVEALIFSLYVSNFARGVHGHQAIVSFLPLVTTVDHGALPWSHWIAASVSRAHAPDRGVVQCACERITRRVGRPAEELSASSSAFCK